MNISLNAIKFLLKINQTKRLLKSNFLWLSTMNSSVKRIYKSDETDDNTSNETLEEVVPKKKKKLLSPEHSLYDTEYYVENGLRKVYPYYYTYHSHCKGRWVGQELAQFYCQEFRGMPFDKINRRIKEGLLLINNEKVDTNYKLKGHDVLTHRVHRHEQPVLSAPIAIVHSSDDMLVIDKPPSIPIHPCGKYRHNSVMSILEKELKLSGLHTIHRLDRLTSGVLVMSRSQAIAQKLHEQMRSRLLTKQYVCRVVGQFPDGVVTCDEPLETLSHRVGICVVSPTGKSCSTSFERLNFNGKSSTVLCKPITGRMHQIRVHLQYLGFPIVNDLFYNNQTFGAQRGKGGDYGKTREQLLLDIEREHNRSIYLMSNKVEESDEEKEIKNKKREIASKALYHYTNQKDWKSLIENYKLDSNKLIKDEECEECLKPTIDPNPIDLHIYLHALSYKGPDWEYKTSIPVWAKDDWNYD